eukprot:Tamp_20283.p1 GENE.Tamp_20283~~Tamp_20283.p1  ORF type:complete len:210 (-),score=22.19 Tamp_20283:72-701(-)
MRGGGRSSHTSTRPPSLSIFLTPHRPVPASARVLGLHHLAADAVELGRADERVHLNVCATRHLAEGEKRLRRGHQHREVAGPERQLAPVGLQPDPPAPRAGIKLHDLTLGAIVLGGSQERVELHTRPDEGRAVRLRVQVRVVTQSAPARVDCFRHDSPCLSPGALAAASAVAPGTGVSAPVFFLDIASSDVATVRAQARAAEETLHGAV